MLDSIVEQSPAKINLFLKVISKRVDGFHNISEFRDWIEGVVPGVPLDIGKKTLQKALKEVFKEMSLTTVPRNWLSVRAVKA